MGFFRDLFNRGNRRLVKNRMNPVTPLVDCSKWRVQGNKLVRAYEFSGLPLPETTASLRIECSLSKYLSGFIDTHLRFYLRPYLYLRPFRQPFEEHLVKAPFSVGLVAAGSGAGTEASPLVQGGVFEVHACSVYDEPDTALLDVTSTEDVMQCVRAISAGKELTFTLLDYQTEPPVRLRLRLSNDREFQQLYNRLRSAI